MALLVVIAGIACARGRGQEAPSPSPLPAATLATTGAASDVGGTLEHDGRQRIYRLRISEAAAGSREAPLVLALHGGNGDMDQICELVGGLPDLLERESFLLLCPQGVGRHWNDGRETDRYQAHREDVDDVGFLRSLVEAVRIEYGVNPDRIYVTGASNGGMMTYRLACEAPSTFRAAAAIIANLPRNLDCEPDEPLPILIMNGTEDPLMPYGGGQVQFLDQELGAVHSTPATAEFWAEKNDCDLPPTVQSLPEAAPGDGTHIELTTYAGCAQDSEVLLYTIVGGGHTWPGGNQYAGRRVIGPVSREGHMGEVVWEFFERH